VRKRIVPEAELDGVIRLKQSGVSWLRIERETGIPRRTAKRAYDDWERSKSMEELKMARTSVAAEEFRRHLNDLVEMARSVVDSLKVPDPMEAVYNSGSFVSVWNADTGVEEKEVPGDRQARRQALRNRMLFQSLRDHTRDRVGWERLRDWEEARSRYLEGCRELHAEALETVRDMLEGRDGLRRRIEASAYEKKAVESMAAGVVRCLWGWAQAGNRDEGSIAVRQPQHGVESKEVVLGGGGSRTVLPFSDGGVADEVAEVCKMAAKRLWEKHRKSLLRNMAEAAGVMEKRGMGFERALDGLMLRPMILRTRCDLCPA